MMNNFDKRFAQSTRKLDLQSIIKDKDYIRKVLDEILDARSAAPVFKAQRSTQIDEQGYGIFSAAAAAISVLNQTTSVFKFLPRVVTDHLTEFAAIFSFMALLQATVKPALRKIMVSSALEGYLKKPLKIEVSAKQTTRKPGPHPKTPIDIGSLEELANSGDIKMYITDKIDKASLGLGPAASLDSQFTAESARVVRAAAKEVRDKDLTAQLLLMAGGGFGGLKLYEWLTSRSRLQDPNDPKSGIKKQDEIKRRVERFKKEVGYNPELGKQ